jgi:hypothetical protein
MTRKGRDGKWSWPMLMYKLGIHLDALRGTIKRSAMRNNRITSVLVSCTYDLFFSYMFTDITERLSLRNVHFYL